MSMVYVKSYLPPEISMEEILHYCSARAGSANLDALIGECLNDMKGKLNYKVCFREFDIEVLDDYVDLGFTKTSSSAIRKYLYGCKKVLLFAATVGIEADRLIKKYGVLSPSKALVISAVGSERVESLCDAFCIDAAEEYRAKGFDVKSRFSPGYADFPIEVQRDVFLALDCERKIGISLNDSLLMTPTKSVTAIVGILEK